MENEKTDTMLHAYVDGELSVEKTLDVEEFLKTSLEARETVRGLRALKSRLSQLASQEEKLPSQLEGKLRQIIVQERRQASLAAPKPRRFSWSWTAAAALLILALNLPFLLDPPPPGAGFLNYAAKSHKQYAQAGRPEVLTADLPGTIQKFNRFFQANWQGNSLNIPKADFIGWCNCRIEGVQDARRLAYQVEGVPVSLYVVRYPGDLPCDLLLKQQGNERLYLTGKCGDFQVVKWQAGALSYILVSQLPKKAMVRVMDSLSF